MLIYYVKPNTRYFFLYIYIYTDNQNNFTSSFVTFNPLVPLLRVAKQRNGTPRSIPRANVNERICRLQTSEQLIIINISESAGYAFPVALVLATFAVLSLPRAN